MVIGLRDKNNKLKVKDLLSINIDMSVEKVEGVFKVRVSRNYYLDNTFNTEKDAEHVMYSLANIRNELEQEFRG